MNTYKSHLTILLFLFMSLSAFSQVGIGIGSNGLNIRTNPDARTGFIIRTGFGIHSVPIQTYLKPEVAWIKRHHYSERTTLYAGLGVSGEMNIGLREMSIGYGALIPVGLELFPLDTKNLSVSLETGLNFMGIGYDEAHFGNYGLLEITFYLAGS